jgi:hypothetical protein
MWQLRIFNDRQLVLASAGGRRMMSWPAMQAAHAKACETHKKAVWLLKHVLCNMRFSLADKVAECTTSAHRPPAEAPDELPQRLSVHATTQVPAQQQ